MAGDDTHRHYVPGDPLNARVGQLVRDGKFRREGVPEDIFPTPPEFVMPLLFAKASLEAAEACASPDDADEIADLAEVLSEIARRAGFTRQDVMAAMPLGSELPGCLDDPRDRDGEAAHWHQAALHSCLCDLSRRLGDPAAHAMARIRLERFAEWHGVSWDEVETARARKKGEFGSYDRAMFWQETPSGGSFVPELGQLLHGQPSQPCQVPEIMDAVLSAIREEYDAAYWNAKQADCPTPFSNNGTKLVTDVFTVEAYSWGADGQEHNFAWRDVRISWYKRCGRSMSSNVPITPAMAAQCLEECLARIRAMDSDDPDDDSNFVDLT